MFIRISARVLPFVLLVVVLSSRARGQGCCVSGSIQPLDWTMSQADLVVRGAVVHVDWRENPANINGRPWRISTVDVSETLKGPATRSVRYVQEEFESDHYRWRAAEDKREKLFFL